MEKKKCKVCNKKLGITALQCKCKNYYCNLHFHFSKHECSFDYKEEARKTLSTTIGGGEFKKIDVI